MLRKNQMWRLWSPTPVMSIKNPHTGHIQVPAVGEIIMDNRYTYRIQITGSQNDCEEKADTAGKIVIPA